MSRLPYAEIAPSIADRIAELGGRPLNLYRVIGNAVFNRPYDTQTTSSRVNNAQGGARTGIGGDLIKQLGDKDQAKREQATGELAASMVELARRPLGDRPQRCVRPRRRARVHPASWPD